MKLQNNTPAIIVSGAFKAASSKRAAVKLALKQLVTHHRPHPTVPVFDNKVGG